MTTKDRASDWPLVRSKLLWREVDERSITGEGTLLSVSKFRGVIPRSEASDRDGRAESLIGYKICRDGDLVINRMSAYDGALGIATETGLVSPDYSVFRPMVGVDGRFYAFLYRTRAYAEQFALLARGIGVGSESNVRTPRLNPSVFGTVVVPCPSLREQGLIADYLDRETAAIRALIEKKQIMMKLVSERRTALRDSVFAHQGHWRLQHLLSAPMAYGVLVPEFLDDGTGVAMIRTYNLSARGHVNHDNLAEIPRALATEYRRTTLRPGDLVVSVVGSMGRAAVVGTAEVGFNINRPLARLQLKPEAPSRLMWHWTQTTIFLDLALLATGGSTAQPTLNLGDLAKFPVGLPSDHSEWPALLARLEAECARLNALEDINARQITLLEERRQAIIAAAIGGQLYVPEAA